MLDGLLVFIDADDQPRTDMASPERNDLAEAGDPDTLTSTARGVAPVRVQIGSLPLSVRAINRLIAMGFKFADQLPELDFARFAKVNGVGRRTLNEVRQFLGSPSPELLEETPKLITPRTAICEERVTILPWSKRTRNCLRKAGIKLVGDLAAYDAASLLALPAFGRKCLGEVRKNLSDLGLSLDTHFGEGAANISEGPTDTHIALVDPRIQHEIHRLRRTQGSRFLHHDDPRLGPMLGRLRAPGLTLLDKLEYLEKSEQPKGVETPKSALRDLRTRITFLSRQTLEEELSELLGAAVSSRQVVLVSRRLGWDGRGGSTLEEAGSELGMTRERARQICKKAVEFLERQRPFAPALDRALKTIRRNPLASATDVEAALLSDGVTRGPFLLEGVESAAGVLGRGRVFKVDQIDGTRVATHSSGIGTGTSIRRIARSAVGRWGACTVSDVSAQATEQIGQKVDSTLAASVLVKLNGFAWLDQPTGWFWILPPFVRRNRLANQIRRTLSVAPRIAISELREAVGRDYRMRGFSPPSRVLSQLCAAIPGCTVQDGFVVRTKPLDPSLDWRRILGGTAKTVTKILLEKGPLMSREALESECRACGMNRTTFYIHLDNSPVITRYARGVYGLPGADAPPGLVESLQPKWKPNKVLKDFGWTPDGRVWLHYRLSRAALSSGVLSVPAGMRRVVLGSFSLRAGDGAIVSRLAIEPGRMMGLKHLFERRGGDVGDSLLLVIDPSKKIATASLTSGDVLEQIEALSKGSTPAS